MSNSRILKGIVAGAALASITGVAVAADPIASLARIDGTVLVNQGQQYVTGREGIALKPGDRIMAMSTGSAVIQFTDGCTYTLDDDEVLTIGETSTCSADTVAKQEIGPYYAAIGENDASGNPNAWASSPAILGATAAILGAASDSGDGQPISR